MSELQLWFRKLMNNDRARNAALVAVYQEHCIVSAQLFAAQFAGLWRIH